MGGGVDARPTQEAQPWPPLMGGRRRLTFELYLAYIMLQAPLRNLCQYHHMVFMVVSSYGIYGSIIIWYLCQK